jgi:hypothetical protein
MMNRGAARTTADHETHDDGEMRGEGARCIARGERMEQLHVTGSGR